MGIVVFSVGFGLLSAQVCESYGNAPSPVPSPQDPYSTAASGSTFKTVDYGEFECLTHWRSSSSADLSI